MVGRSRYGSNKFGRFNTLIDRANNRFRCNRIVRFGKNY